MTRKELIEALLVWDPPGYEVWDRATFMRRNELQFALWWYGKSTEASKPDPTWPSDDYIASKTGSGPRYLDSIDDALSLVPAGWAWSAQKSDSTGCDVWLYPPDNDADQEVYVYHDRMAVAICIAAIAARDPASLRSHIRRGKLNV